MLAAPVMMTGGGVTPALSQPEPGPLQKHQPRRLQEATQVSRTWGWGAADTGKKQPAL